MKPAPENCATLRFYFAFILPNAAKIEGVQIDLVFDRPDKVITAL